VHEASFIIKDATTNSKDCFTVNFLSTLGLKGFMPLVPRGKTSALLNSRAEPREKVPFYQRMLPLLLQRFLLWRCLVLLRVVRLHTGLRARRTQLCFEF